MLATGVLYTCCYEGRFIFVLVHEIRERMWCLLQDSRISRSVPALQVNVPLERADALASLLFRRVDRETTLSIELVLAS